jgi:integrase
MSGPPDNIIHHDAGSSTPALPVSGTVALPQAELIHPDLESVALWLAHLHEQAITTRVAYRREALRFLAWLEQTKGLGARLQQVNSADAIAYRTHLLTPRIDVSPAIYQRFGFKGAPWKGGMQVRTAAHVLVILSAFFESMRRMVGPNGQVIQQHNPFYRLHETLSADIPSPRGRALSSEQWVAVLETIDSWDEPDAEHAARCRWLFLLAYYSFLRRHEIARLRMGDFRRLPSGAWVIKVLGKGRTLLDIAAPPALMEALADYRRHHGLSPEPVAGDPTAAVLPFKVRGEVMTPSAIYKIFKVIFLRASERYPQFATVFERTSTHWMRHTGVTHAMDSGIDPRFIQKQARHKLFQTTSDYDNRTEEKLADAFSKMTAPGTVKATPPSPPAAGNTK